MFVCLSWWLLGFIGFLCASLQSSSALVSAMFFSPPLVCCPLALPYIPVSVGQFLSFFFFCSRRPLELRLWPGLVEGWDEGFCASLVPYVISKLPLWCALGFIFVWLLLIPPNS